MATHGHQLKPLGEPGDDPPNPEHSRLTPVVGAVELGSVDESSLVVDGHPVLRGRTGAVAFSNHLVLKATLGNRDPFLLCVFSQEGLSLNRIGLGFCGHSLTLLGIHSLGESLDGHLEFVLRDRRLTSSHPIPDSGPEGVHVQEGLCRSKLCTHLEADSVAGLLVVCLKGGGATRALAGSQDENGESESSRENATH